MINDKFKKKVKKLILLLKIQAKYLFDYSNKYKVDYSLLPTLYYSSRKNKSKLKILENNFNIFLLVGKYRAEHFRSTNVFNSKFIPKSSASLYILDLGTVKNLKSESIYANYVSIPLSAIFLNTLLVFKFLKTGRYLFKSVKFCGWLMLIFKSSKQQELNSNTRKYIPKDFDRTTFLQQLKMLNINAVALRWFDNFEVFKDNLEEDIDLLIDDIDIYKFNLLLKGTIGVLPIDVYSVSGLPGTTYAGMPYYPFSLAKKILETKHIHINGFYIPNDTYFFYSFCYHVVFHKAILSGLPINKKRKAIFKNPEHAYKKIIFELLNKQKIKSVDVNLTSLYYLLIQKGIAPSYDLVLKLANYKKDDKWYKHLVFIFEDEIASNFNYVKGLSVFIIRERAFKNMNARKIKRIFSENGFEILSHSKISKENISTIISNIRGGNWSKGPFKVSGGNPAYFFVVYDPFPIKPNNKELKQYPNLENKKTISVKKILRSYFNESQENNFNGVHSSDNFFEAIDYLKLIYAENQINTILESISSIDKSYRSDYDVIKDFSRNANRAKVELINFKGKKAIQKTFRNGSENFLQNEIFFLESFKDSSFSPKLFKKGENKIIIEYFDDAKGFGNLKGFLRAKVILEIRKIILEIFNKNITILDLNPSNVLYYKGEVKLIDFEFASYYKNKPKSIYSCYELSKIPNNYNGPKPAGNYYNENVYKAFWENKFFLTKKQFIEVNNTVYIAFLMRFNFVYFKIKRWLTN